MIQTQGKKIKNEAYKSFLSGQLFQKINREEFTAILENVKYKHQKQARALVIMAWMSAGRPNEYMSLVAEDITKKGNYLKIRLRGSKGSYAREILLPFNDEWVKEVWEYNKKLFPKQYVFWSLRSQSKRKSTTRTFYKKGPDGLVQKHTKVYEKEYEYPSHKLWYHFQKWMKLPPYYLRHNRLSIVAETAKNPNQLMLLKGAKSWDSVRVYLHQSEEQAKKTAKDLIR